MRLLELTQWISAGVPVLTLLWAFYLFRVGRRDARSASARAVYCALEANEIVVHNLGTAPVSRLAVFTTAPPREVAGAPRWLPAGIEWRCQLFDLPAEAEAVVEFTDAFERRWQVTTSFARRHGRLGRFPRQPDHDDGLRLRASP